MRPRVSCRPVVFHYPVLDNLDAVQRSPAFDTGYLMQHDPPAPYLRRRIHRNGIKYLLHRFFPADGPDLTGGVIHPPLDADRFQFQVPVDDPPGRFLCNRFDRFIQLGRVVAFQHLGIGIRRYAVLQQHIPEIKPVIVPLDAVPHPGHQRFVVTQINRSTRSAHSKPSLLGWTFAPKAYSPRGFAINFRRSAVSTWYW